MRYALAVDGGGTKTEFVVIDKSGSVKGRVRSGASNYQNLGEDAARRILEQGVAEVLKQAGIALGEIEAACLGLAGLDTEEDERNYRRILADVFGERASAARLESDCFIAIHSGTFGAAGLAVIAGTGSMAIGVNESGDRYRSGGWGYLFGDEGSAFDLGRRGMVRALKARDGRGPETQLVSLFEEAFGRDLFDQAIELLQIPIPVTEVAQLARIVDQAARQGDEVARDVVAEAAEELLAAADAVVRRLSFSKRPLRFVLAGGAFRSDLLRTLVTDGLKAGHEDAVCIQPDVPVVAGAAVLALEAMGVPVSDGVRARLRETLTEDQA